VEYLAKQAEVKESCAALPVYFCIVIVVWFLVTFHFRTDLV